MNKISCMASVLLVAASSLPQAIAAPLDAFTTTKAPGQGTLQLEAGYDVVNNTLDFLKLRAKDPVYGGTTVGDYSGYHVRTDYGLTDHLSLEGELWQRKISNPGDTASINSWKLSGQYRFYGDNEPVDLALRVGAWGNYANELKKATPTQIMGKTAQTILVDNPRDQQVQADLIGTWSLSPRTAWSAFVGGGVSQVEVAGLSATAIGNGCKYNLSFTETMATATLAAPCGGLISLSASSPNTTLQEFTYRSTYYQAGSMLQWNNHGWQLKAGYHFQHLNRGSVDTLITNRGGVSYQNNHIVTVEVARRVARHVAAFVRGQAMSNQFVGEIPFVYNTMTANKFGRIYGFATFGVMFSL